MADVLKDREILVGVCGGIAAYKTADVVSKLVQAGAKVTVVMTHAAKEFIGKTTFEALTGRPVYQDMFAPIEHPVGEHIGLARLAKMFVIAPATADMIAKLANGFADDLVSTLALTTTCPLIVAPAMNNEMWSKPSVQRNMTHLVSDGVHIVGPGSGWLSCGVIGPGRMAEPTEIIEAIKTQFTHADS
jgi:phosphopantothenoylcysteine decarboxylase/phosphopantothenate--cysteine ligase